MQPDKTNIYLARYGVWVVLAGLGVILTAFAISVFVFEPNAADVSTALAPMTGVIGTLVGAYFGVQVGAQGRHEAEATSARANEQAVRLASVADPQRVAEILGESPPAGASGAGP